VQNSIPTFDVGLQQVQGSAQPIGACDPGSDLFAELFAELMSCAPAAEPGEIPLQGWSDKGVVSPEGPGVLITPSVPAVPAEGEPSLQSPARTTTDEPRKDTNVPEELSEPLKLPESPKPIHVEEAPKREKATLPQPAMPLVVASIGPADAEITAEPPTTPSKTADLNQTAPGQPIVSHAVLPKTKTEVTTKLPLAPIQIDRTNPSLPVHHLIVGPINRSAADADAPIESAEPPSTPIKIERPNPTLPIHHLIVGPINRPAADADAPIEPPEPPSTPIRIEQPNPTVPMHHLIVGPINRPVADADAPAEPPEPPSTPISIDQPNQILPRQPIVSPIAVSGGNANVPVVLAEPATIDFAIHDVKAFKVDIEMQPAQVMSTQPVAFTVLPFPIHMPIRTLSTSSIAALINRHGPEPPVQPEAPSDVRPTIFSTEPFKISVGTGDMAKDLTQQESGTDQETHTLDTPKTQSQTINVPEGTPAHFERQLSTVHEARPVQHLPELPPTPHLTVARRVSIEIGENESKVMVTLHEHRGDVSVKIHAGSEQLRADLQSSVGNLVEAFQRERVSLANMDFTSGHATSADPNHQRQNHPQQRFQSSSRKNLRPEAPFSDVEMISEETTIRILA